MCKPPGLLPLRTTLVALQSRILLQQRHLVVIELGKPISFQVGIKDSTPTYNQQLLLMCKNSYFHKEILSRYYF